jgi:hypothetical protein
MYIITGTTDNDTLYRHTGQRFIKHWSLFNANGNDLEHPHWIAGKGFIAFCLMAIGVRFPRYYAAPRIPIFSLFSWIHYPIKNLAAKREVFFTSLLWVSASVLLVV